MDYPEIQLPGQLSAVSVVPGRSRSSDTPGSDEATQPGPSGQLDAELDGIRSARKALQQAAGKIQELQGQFLAEAQQQLVDLSIEIAKKVLMQEIQADRHQIDPIVTEAISRVPDRTDIVVHLHPDDLARCGQADKSDEASDKNAVSFVADPKVHRGGCLLQTSRGDVESSIDGQLEEIAQALKNPE